jgi:hypothetical protein
MSRFYDLLQPLSPDELAADQAVKASRGAVVAVQMSLWRRLSKGRPRGRAGSLAWLLVRLGQPSHREHRNACASADDLEGAALVELLAAVRATASAATGPARELADRIAWRLDPGRDPWRYDAEGAAWAAELAGLGEDMRSPRARELLALMTARLEGRS